MPVPLYRTHATSLTNDDLVILDVLFHGAAIPAMLRRRHFKEQWNAEPHRLDDAALESALDRMLKDGILERGESQSRRHHVVRMTPHGGDLWSRERCPIWQRYCLDRYNTLPCGSTLLTIVAVAAEIRDHFLDVWPEYPARKRTKMIRDVGLNEWRSFGTLHVGLATYIEPDQWSCEEYELYRQRHQQYLRRVDTSRTWWRSVAELQRFVPAPHTG